MIGHGPGEGGIADAVSLGDDDGEPGSQYGLRVAGAGAILVPAGGQLTSRIGGHCREPGLNLSRPADWIGQDDVGGAGGTNGVDHGLQARDLERSGIGGEVLSAAGQIATVVALVPVAVV